MNNLAGLLTLLVPTMPSDLGTDTVLPLGKRLELVFHVVSRVVQDPSIARREKELKKTIFSMLAKNSLGPESATKEGALQVAAHLIKRHFCSQTCQCNPLPSTISHPRMKLTELDMLRVFYIKIEDRNRQFCPPDGWTCGFRDSLFSAALQRLIDTGTTELCHAKLGDYIQEFRSLDPAFTRGGDTDLSFNTFLTFIAHRKIADAAISTLLEDDTKKKETALCLLEGNQKSVFEVLSEVHIDFFILEAISSFLNNECLGDALSILGKAESGRVKNIGVLITRAIVGKVSPADQEEIDQLANSLAPLIDQVLESMSLHSPAEQSKKNLIKELLNRDRRPVGEVKNVCALLTDQNRREEMFALIVGGSSFSMRRTLDRLCQLDTTIDEKVRALRNLVADAIKNNPLDEAELLSLRREVEFHLKSDIHIFAQALCQKNHRLTMILNALHGTRCSKVKGAIALLQGINIDHDEIVAFLKETTEREKIDDVLARVCVDAEGRCVLQKCIYEITDLADASAERIRQLLESVSVRVGAGVQLLDNFGEAGQNNDAIPSITGAIRAIGRKHIEEGLRILCPRYPDPNESFPEFFEGRENALSSIRQEFLHNERDERIVGALDALKKVLPDFVAARRILLDEVNANGRSVFTCNNALKILELADNPLDQTVLMRLLGQIEVQKEALSLAYRQLQGLKFPRLRVLADPQDPVILAQHPAFKIPPECVHVLSNEQREGVVLSLGDYLMEGIFRERGLGQQADRALARSWLEQAIKEDLRKAVRGGVDDDDEVPASRAHYFYCRINNCHWMLVSVVRFKDKKPIVVVIDSMNGPIHSETGPGAVESADKMISFVYNTFVREYYT